MTYNGKEELYSLLLHMNVYYSNSMAI